MSKQYLIAHTVEDNSTASDVFSIALTRNQLLSVSGGSTVGVHDCTTEGFPRTQSIAEANNLGAHHITASADGRSAVTVGFGGHVKLWRIDGDSSGEAQWKLAVEVTEGINLKKCEIWAVSLSEDGRYLAATTHDGRCLVWDTWGAAAAAAVDNPASAPESSPHQNTGNGKAVAPAKIREFETTNSRGSFGLCVDMSPDGTLTATGHVSGHVYVFANSTGRLAHALPSLNAPVRAVKFSPGGKLLATAGDNTTIVLHDPNSSIPVAQLRGHTAWIFSIAFSPTGERLASVDWSGRIRIWDIERRECVWTGHVEEGGPLWSVQWLLETRGGHFGALGRCEGFAVAGAKGLVRVFREAAGG